MKYYQFITRSITVFVISFLVYGSSYVAAQDKLPAEKAGTISKPTGDVAFIRDGHIWVYHISSNTVEIISEMANNNAVGRLSWSPDGKQIMFTRSGLVDYSGTADDGGKHKLYDLFVAYLDSVSNGNRKFWRRLTFDFGSRDPEWSADGKTILFWNDKNASLIDPVFPNYQLITMNPDGDYPNILRKDWQIMEDVFMVSPSMNSNNVIACVLFFDFKPQGMVVFPKSEVMMSIDSLKAMATKNRDKIAPSWSPDNKWIVYTKNKIDDAGLYIVSGDLKETYKVFTPPVSTYINTAAPASFSPDSKHLTFATTDGSIWIVNITGIGARRLTPPGLDGSPVWSK